MSARLGLALAVAMVLATPVWAQATPTVLFEDNFDSYADQAAFEAVWPPFPNAAIPSGQHLSLTLSNEQSVSPTQSAKNPGVTTAQGTNESPRNRLFFTDSGLPAPENLVHFEFNFYDSAEGGNPYRSYTGIFNSAAPSSSGGLVQMGMNNNQLAAANGGNYYMGRVFGYDPLIDGETVGGNGAFFKLNGVGTDDPAAVPLRSLGWHKLGVTISDVDFKFYVDDILARVVDRADGFNGTPVTVRSFDEIRMGAGVSNNNNASYFDDMRVVLNPIIVPPPTEDADFDGDGDVDGADFLTWQQNLGVSDGSAELADGDADDNGNVDAADLAVWQDQFGTGAAVPAASAIPEPATLALSALALLGGLAVTRRR